MRLFGDARLLTAPELLEDPNHAAMSAGDFWIENHCGLPAMHDDVVGVTERVNGGINGIDARKAWLDRFKKSLGVPT